MVVVFAAAARNIAAGFRLPVAGNGSVSRGSALGELVAVLMAAARATPAAVRLGRSTRWHGSAILLVILIAGVLGDVTLPVLLLRVLGRPVGVGGRLPGRAMLIAWTLVAALLRWRRRWLISHRLALQAVVAAERLGRRASSRGSLELAAGRLR